MARCFGVRANRGVQGDGALCNPDRIIGYSILLNKKVPLTNDTIGRAERAVSLNTPNDTRLTARGSKDCQENAEKYIEFRRLPPQSVRPYIYSSNLHREQGLCAV